MKPITELKPYLRNILDTRRRQLLEKSRETCAFEGQNNRLLGKIGALFIGRADSSSAKKANGARRESSKVRKNGLRLFDGCPKTGARGFKVAFAERSKEKIAKLTLILCTFLSPSFGNIEPPPPAAKSKTIKHRLTVYYPGQDAWTSRLQSASGYTLKDGISVATDLRTYDFGDTIFIEGIGQRVVHDTGTAVKERTASGGRYPVIDIFFKSKSEALRFANRVTYANVYLVKDQ